MSLSGKDSQWSRNTNSTEKKKFCVQQSVKRVMLIADFFKSATVNSASYYQFLGQNSSY